MRLVCALSLLGVTLQFSCILNAQQFSIAVQRNAQAISILKQSVAVAGGSSVVGSIQDYAGSGTISYFEGGSEVPGSVAVYAKGLSQFRLDANLPEGLRSQVVNSSDGLVSGSTKDDSSVLTPIPYHNAVSYGSLTLPVLHLLAALNDPATNILYLGLTSANGQQLHQIRIEPLATEGDPGNLDSRLRSRTFYIDPISFQITRVATTLHPDYDSTVDFSRTVDFSDYRMINGILVPFSMIETIDGHRAWVIQLSQVALNSGLSDAVFQL